MRSSQIGFFGTFFVVLGVLNGCSQPDPAATARQRTSALVWTQSQKLQGADIVANYLFATSVAVSADGNTLLAGCPTSSAATKQGGVAYVFVWDSMNLVYKQKQLMFPTDSVMGGQFGYAVALAADGKSALIGALANAGKTSLSGAAYAFAYNAATDLWEQRAKLQASDGQDNDYFGFATALTPDGKTALIGAIEDDDKGSSSGSAYVFAYDAMAAVWKEQGKLTASDGAAGDWFGFSAALTSDGKTALIGAETKNSTSFAEGAAYVFAYNTMTAKWTQSAKLVPGGPGASSYFGSAVALSDDGKLLIGAKLDDAKASQAGAVYPFLFNAATGTYTPQARLLASDGTASSNLGSAVAIAADGKTAIVGASGQTTADPTGTAYIYRFDGGTGTWVEGQRLKPSDLVNTNRFGNAAALSAGGTTAFIGAFLDDEFGKSAGAAYVFKLKGASGEACSAGIDCASGFCSDGVCCNNACGGSNGNDCQACSVAAGATTNGVCALLPANVVCRDAAGLCDVVDKCSGTSAACPDTFKLMGTLCRDPVGGCDLFEACTGSGPQCPADKLQAAGVVCRTSVGICDPDEKCSGTDPNCPPDALFDATRVCRPSIAPCDPAEVCDGVKVTCPADKRAAAGTLCRGAATPCDAPEYCDGVMAACPTDRMAPLGTLCRPAIGPCDVTELCDGRLYTCPADKYAAVGQVCRPKADLCDAEEVCTGTSTACPADVLAPADTVCRPVAGLCDVLERCNGNEAACPPDAFLPATETCRAKGGVCDVAESCTGTGPACPSDAFAPPGLLCRAATGPTDVTEVCDGTQATCPPDVQGQVERSGTQPTGCQVAPRSPRNPTLPAWLGLLAVLAFRRARRDRTGPRREPGPG